MAWGAHGEYGTQTQLKVPKQETTTQGDYTHKKAAIMDMSVSHRFGTAYPLSAVMNGMRGDPDPQREQHGDLNLQSFNRPETMKKGKFGPTAQHNGAIGSGQSGFVSNMYF